jgi:probable addiction module antidote protein
MPVEVPQSATIIGSRARIAKDAGLGRESLYKALSSGAHPRYETVKR